VSIAVIDALELQLAPLSRALRFYARVQIGCQALIEAYYGIGELTAVTILAELGDCRRFQNSRDAVRYGGLETVASNCTSRSGDLGLVVDVARVRDPLAGFLFDLGAERDPESVSAVCGELAVTDPVVDGVG
jgi:Transposase IS116/IS110/IS902 family